MATKKQDSKLDKLNEKLKQQEGKIRDQDASIKQLRTSNTTRDSTIQQNKSSIKELRSLNKEQESTIQQLRAEIQDLSKNNDELKRRIMKLDQIEAQKHRANLIAELVDILYLLYALDSNNKDFLIRQRHHLVASTLLKDILGEELSEILDEMDTDGLSMLTLCEIEHIALELAKKANFEKLIRFCEAKGVTASQLTYLVIVKRERNNNSHFNLKLPKSSNNKTRFIKKIEDFIPTIPHMLFSNEMEKQKEDALTKGLKGLVNLFDQADIDKYAQYLSVM